MNPLHCRRGHARDALQSYANGHTLSRWHRSVQIHTSRRNYATGLGSTDGALFGGFHLKALLTALVQSCRIESTGSFVARPATLEPCGRASRVTHRSLKTATLTRPRCAAQGRGPRRTGEPTIRSRPHKKPSRMPSGSRSSPIVQRTTTLCPGARGRPPSACSNGFLQAASLQLPRLAPGPAIRDLHGEHIFASRGRSAQSGLTRSTPLSCRFSPARRSLRSQQYKFPRPPDQPSRSLEVPRVPARPTRSSVVPVLDAVPSLQSFTSMAVLRFSNADSAGSQLPRNR